MSSMWQSFSKKLNIAGESKNEIAGKSLAQNRQKSHKALPLLNPPSPEEIKRTGSVTARGDDDHSWGGAMEEAIMRRFFFTENPYMGLVSEETEVGDEIWLVKGGRVPLVLRRRDNEIGGGYELVGDGLIHGLMYGERFVKEECVKVTIY